MSSAKLRKILSKTGVTALLLIGSFISLVPLFWLVRSSFMEMVDIFIFPPILWPKKMVWANYTEVLFSSFPFFQYLINTMTILVPVLFGTVITGSMAAYAFARLKFPLKNFFFMLILSSMMLPGAVTLIPTFLMWQSVGLINTYAPLIIPAFFGGSAVNIFMMRQFFRTIPKDLDEAALIDGAGFLRIFFQILLPLMKPTLIVISIFTFLGCWNDFFGPLIYLYDNEKYTLALGLQVFSGSYGGNWGIVMAGATIVTIPAIIIFFIGQRYFVQGIVMSGIKG